MDTNQMLETVELTSELAPPNNSAELANTLYQVDRIDEHILNLQKQCEEAVNFYARKIESIENRKAFLLGQITGYLEFHQLKSLSTHKGTASLVTREHVQWPTDEEIIQWIEKTAPDEGLIRIKKEPNKIKLKAYLADKGDILPGVTKSTTTTLQIRKRGE